MINYGLPTSVMVNGSEYAINSDFRAILDICTALNDPDLSDKERAFVALTIFYRDISKINSDDMQEAIRQCMIFLNGGEEETAGASKPKLIDWEQDFQYIIAPVNRVAGQEVRAVQYMHWWTFLSYYNEIGGDCTFAQIVRIREKLAKHKKLDADDREWLRQNREKVEFRKKYTDAEKEILEAWMNHGERCTDTDKDRT